MIEEIQFVCTLSNIDNVLNMYHSENKTDFTKNDYLGMNAIFM